nr:hypothetical protein [Candidatus Bathyarchaeota archaeon]
MDVELEIDNKKIACEISITSSPVQELANIKKCLQAGYKEVILCSPKERNLKRVKSLVSNTLKDSDQEKILFLQPEELFSYLDDLTTLMFSKEKRIKGYKVKVQYQPLNEEDKRARREAVAQVIFQSLRRQKTSDAKR